MDSEAFSRIAAWDLPAVDHLAALDGRCTDSREAEGEQRSDGGGGVHFELDFKRM